MTVLRLHLASSSAVMRSFRDGEALSTSEGKSQFDQPDISAAEYWVKYQGNWEEGEEEEEEELCWDIDTGWIAFADILNSKMGRGCLNVW